VKTMHPTESLNFNPEYSKHAVWFKFIYRAASSYTLLHFYGVFIVLMSPLHCSFILLSLFTYILYQSFR
jgi:hypothetical protein